MQKQIAVALLCLCGCTESGRPLTVREKPTMDWAATQLGFREGQPVRIEARGRKFEWHFRYPGRDGRLGSEDDIHVAGDLNLPVGATVELILESDDFIYLWSSPELGLKEIAVPQLVHSLTFQASSLGQFDILADPMCGWQFFHDDVLGQVVIRTPTAFNHWSVRQFAGSLELQDD